MLNLKRKFHSNRRLNSASSSTAGSVSDLEDRVVMLCEDIPAENSFDSGRGSQSPGPCSSRGSHSEEHQSRSEPHTLHLSRDRLSYRQASYILEEPTQAHREYYMQGVVQVYEYLIKLFQFGVLENHLTVQTLLYIHEMHFFPLNVLHCKFQSF